MTRGDRYQSRQQTPSNKPISLTLLHPQEREPGLPTPAPLSREAALRAVPNPGTGAGAGPARQREPSAGWGGGVLSLSGSVGLGLRSPETFRLGPPSPLGLSPANTPNPASISKAEQGTALECVDWLSLWAQVEASLCSWVLFVPLCGRLNACLCVSEESYSERLSVDVCLYDRVLLCVGVCVSFCVSAVRCWCTVRAYVCPHTPVSRNVGVRRGLSVCESECGCLCFCGCLLLDVWAVFLF